VAGPDAAPDGDGLVAAFLLDGAGGGRALDFAQVLRWRPGDGLLWVHMDLTVPATARWMAAEGDLDPLVAEALLQVETRPRGVALRDGLLIVLRGVNMNPGADPEDMVSMRMWLTPERIVTTRRRRLLSVDDTRQAIAEGRGPITPGDFLVTMADRMMERAARVVGDVDEAVDRLEEEVLAAESHALRAALADMRREAIGLRRYLAPQREALTRLSVEPHPLLTDVDRLRLREVADAVTRHVEDLDAARERAAVVQEELASRLAEQLNQRMYVLSAVAALFLPLGFVTGLLGVNVGGIPGGENPRAFLDLSALLAVLAVAVLAVFKWRRWF
jgi:zinc transporter